jgi:hypothetical protein
VLKAIFNKIIIKKDKFLDIKVMINIKEVIKILKLILELKEKKMNYFHPKYHFLVINKLLYKITIIIIKIPL